jgi:hypothetical protein
MQLSRDGLMLHLSEHHGDAAPGGTTVVRTTGIEKDYKYNRPGLDIAPYGAKVMYTIDPFGNRLRFEREVPKCDQPGNLTGQSEPMIGRWAKAFFGA